LPTFADDKMKEMPGYSGIPLIADLTRNHGEVVHDYLVA